MAPVIGVLPGLDEASHDEPQVGMFTIARWLATGMIDIPTGQRDLLESETAVLATIGPDERPQLSAVRFIVEGDLVKVSVNTSRQKASNLRASPGVNVLVLDGSAPARDLEIRGDAEVTDDPDDAFAERAGRDHDADLRSFDDQNAHRVVVTLRPVRVNAVDMLRAGRPCRFSSPRPDEPTGAPGREAASSVKSH